MEEYISFEELWHRLLDKCDVSLKTLSTVDDKDQEIRRMWVEIHSLISMMAIPSAVVSRMRRVLFIMAWRSSWKQCWTILQFTLLTFFPRRYYQNVPTQNWFKKRLKNNR